MNNPQVAGLKDNDYRVRRFAAETLGKFGDVSVVPALIEALKEKDPFVRRKVAAALKQIGDSDTLPRIILADSRFSAQERIDVLESLRRVHYKDDGILLRYTFPETRTLCQTVLNGNDDARKDAQTVLNWLNGERDLLRTPQPNTTNQAHELVRPTQSGEPETQMETLLRAIDAQENDTEPRPTLRQRLFGKRKASKNRL